MDRFRAACTTPACTGAAPTTRAGQQVVLIHLAEALAAVLLLTLLTLPHPDLFHILRVLRAAVPLAGVAARSSPGRRPRGRPRLQHPHPLAGPTGPTRNPQGVVHNGALPPPTATRQRHPHQLRVRGAAGAGVAARPQLVLAPCAHNAAPTAGGHAASRPTVATGAGAGAGARPSLGAPSPEPGPGGWQAWGHHHSRRYPDRGRALGCRRCPRCPRCCSTCSG